MVAEPDPLATRTGCAGTRGPDVSAGMTWMPFVTFWQVTADMAFSTGVPEGHGHHYVADYVNGWADVAQPPGWTRGRHRPPAPDDRLMPGTAGTAAMPASGCRHASRPALPSSSWSG